MAFLRPRDIIPEGWEDKHRPILEGSMTAICELRGPQGAYEYETGTYEPGELLAENIACRVLPQGEGRGGSAVDQLTDTRAYQITAPVQQVPELNINDKGPIIYVTGYKTGHAGDPQLIGRALRVTNVYVGSLIWERVITATMEV